MISVQDLERASADLCLTAVECAAAVDYLQFSDRAARGDEDNLLDFSVDLLEFPSEPDGPRRPPPWLVSISREFVKESRGQDRKLLGRVLEAIEELVGYGLPLQPVGDTFKPLQSQLRGYWRYRLGDFRLVVLPRVGDGIMELVRLAPRSAVYE